MQLQDLNPHVVNSLLCLVGIVLCLGLIAWGGWSDRRRLRGQIESQAEQRRMPPRFHPAPKVTLNDEPHLDYRQVA